MSLVEAKSIIQEKRNSEPILSEQLAARMRETVGVKLDDTVTLKDLYYATHTHPNPGAGLEWLEFVLSLETREKRAITRSLGGLAYMESNQGETITVGDIRNIDDIKTFSKQRGYNKSVFGLSFFKLAFEQGDVNV